MAPRVKFTAAPKPRNPSKAQRISFNFGANVVKPRKSKAEGGGKGGGGGS
jgi:hypothetical protein